MFTILGPSYAKNASLIVAFGIVNHSACVQRYRWHVVIFFGTCIVNNMDSRVIFMYVTCSQNVGCFSYAYVAIRLLYWVISIYMQNYRTCTFACINPIKITILSLWAMQALGISWLLTTILLLPCYNLCTNSKAFSLFLYSVMYCPLCIDCIKRDLYTDTKLYVEVYVEVNSLFGSGSSHTYCR